MLRSHSCGHNKKKPFQQSVFKGSLFEGAHNKPTIMLFLCHWLCGVTTKEIGLCVGWLKGKVNRWMKKTQDHITVSVAFDHQMVGGCGIAVETDVSKFVKRKRLKGHRVEDCWVFGGVELTPERRCVAVTVTNRKRETPIPIIQAHIAPGSIIHIDFWKAHDIIPFLPDEDCVHEKANHLK